MERNRRTAREVAEEFRRLIEQSDSDRDRATLLHEVQVYQEELTVQNDALRDMQTALEETRDRFIELYDFAPTAYITVNEHGVMQQVNLTAASWLGKSKQALERMPLIGFLHYGDRDRWMAYLRSCRDYDSGPAVSAVLRMRSADGPRVVEALCKPHHKAAREYFIAMIDVTEQRQLQREREESAQARAALAGRLISIQEDERLRIARDLHDNLGQMLTGLRLRLDAIALARTVDDLFHQQVQEALTLVERLDRGIDFIATELRPASLDFGFDIALQQFVNDWSTTFGIEAAFHSTPLRGLRLSPETQTHLYRIAQEALNNVYKHSGAKRTSVILERRHDSLVLLVEDDGRGFEHAHLDRVGRRSLGLIGMRERATMIGATLEVESARGTGTTVFVTMPGAFAGSQRAAHAEP